MYRKAVILWSAMGEEVMSVGLKASDWIRGLHVKFVALEVFGPGNSLTFYSVRALRELSQV
ncbi:hypothetical protein GCM10008940_07020 [Microbulbifer agarilyticus]